MSRTLSALVIILSLIACTSSATTITVDVGGGGDWTEIQPALNAAGEGDTVLVMPGTYMGGNNTNLMFGGVNIVLRSAGGRRAATIDCQDAARAFWFGSGEGPASVVEGITVTNGSNYTGGGVYCSQSSPTFIDCTFSDCSSEYGGAAYLWTASPVFTGCTFSGNEATGDAWGGAVYAEITSAVFEDCTFSDNSTAHHGGAIYFSQSDDSVIGCTFAGNSANDHGGSLFCTDSSLPYVSGCSFLDGDAGIGGALSCVFGSNATINDCLFSGHTGYSAFYADASSPTFADCSFHDNSGGYCGGVYLYDSTSQLTGCVFWNNTVTAGHRGGGALYCDDADPVLLNCTFAMNGADGDGGTIHVREGAPSFTNCIVSHGTSGPAVDCNESYTTDPTFVCSNVYGNAGGDWIGCIAGQGGVNNNMTSDPLFCDAPGGDFTIDAASPCAPAQSPVCGLIGALDVGCDSPVEVMSWGAIKRLFR